MKRTGFSIVELVVVLAIIAILGAIAFPAVQRVREAARETVCKNNVKQLNLALSQYGETAGIPAFNGDGTISGWAIEILPFLDQGNLKSDLPEGKVPEMLPEPYCRQPSVFRCPAQAVKRNEPANVIASAHYVLVAMPVKKRESYSIAEAPISLNKPWVISPEVSSFDELRPGAHNGGYFYASGFQHDVQFSKPRNR